MSDYSHIKINIENTDNTFNFYFCYNQNTTYEDLFDFILYNYPEKNLCPCYKFVDPKSSSSYINKNNKLAEYLKKSSSLQIRKNPTNKECDHSSSIKYYKKSKSELITCILDLDKGYKNKMQTLTQQIISLNEKMSDKTNILREEIKKEYENEFSKLKKENDILIHSINGDIEKINQLKNFGIINDNLKEKDNMIKIDPNSNVIAAKTETIKVENFADFYDVIIEINSVKDIINGWEIKKSKRAEEQYNSLKKEKIMKIGVIGNSNKGKSFLLSKLSKIKLPSGTSIRTEGLSIKYPELDIFKDRKIALLDSAGLETPVLREDKDKNLEQELKKNNENEKNENENENNSISEKEIFREKSREKLITELFLQNYIMYNSDILILVVGILTYSEQKLLNRIRTDIQRAKIKKPLFIIHNLITYISIEQVKEYINSYLLKSATFDLEEGHKISTKVEQTNGIYYYEKNMEPKIYHLIFANEGSEAGKFFNQFTLDFIEGEYQGVTDLKPFDVIEAVKERFVKLSNEIFEKIEKPITVEDFSNSNNNSLILQNVKELTLKKCLIDELGFSNLKVNGFEPTYNYYKEDGKIIIRVEAPGNSTVKTNLVYSREYTIIRVIGTKKKDKKPEKLEDNIFNSREIGTFSFEIPLKNGDYLLKNEAPTYSEKKGIIIIEFKLDDKVEDKGFGQEEDEV